MIPKEQIFKPSYDGSGAAVMQTAYIDESGYTGGDLLDSDQPFMSLSAVFIDPDEAEQLKDKHFPTLQAPELKHSSLSKRPVHHKPLLAIQRDCLDHYRAISYIVDKRYMCIRKMLDDCIEPVWYEQGVDFNANGNSIVLASAIYYAAPRLWGEGKLDELLQLYQTASKEKTPEAVDALSTCVRSIEEAQLASELDPIADKHQAFVEEITSKDTSTDISYSLMWGLITQLEKLAGGPYNIIHDTSKSMRRYHEHLEVIAAITDEKHFKISDLCEVNYPLQLQDVGEGESHIECGLQLADVLAGGVIAGLKATAGIGPVNDYTSNVSQSYSDHNLMHMLPDLDFAETRQRFEGTQMTASVDHISRKLAEKHMRSE